LQLVDERADVLLHECLHLSADCRPCFFDCLADVLCGALHAVPDLANRLLERLQDFAVALEQVVDLLIAAHPSRDGPHGLTLRTLILAVELVAVFELVQALELSKARGPVGDVVVDEESAHDLELLVAHRVVAFEVSVPPALGIPPRLLRLGQREEEREALEERPALLQL
jgi:hypothetical protein